MERLDWLVESSNTWQGPVSVVVFVPDQEFDVAQLYISYLRSCYSRIRDNLAWSFVHPVNKPPRASNIKIKTSVSCSDQRAFLQSLVRSVYSSKDYSKWRTGFDYPQNHLRNVARDNSLTHYTISLDVDIILSPGNTYNAVTDRWTFGHGRYDETSGKVPQWQHLCQVCICDPQV